MRGGSRPGAGRKPLKFDLEVVERLCSLGCTNEELAGVLNCSVRTIEIYSKKPKFGEAMARGRAKMRVSLRRNQFKAAEKGNGTMLRWLGMQYLGQRYVMPIEVSAPNGAAATLTIAAMDEIVDRVRKARAVQSDIPKMLRSFDNDADP
jgi:hypothetical protein